MELFLAFVLGSFFGLLISAVISFLANPWAPFPVGKRTRKMNADLRAAVELKRLVNLLGNIDAWLSSTDALVVKELKAKLWQQTIQVEIAAQVFFVKHSKTNTAKLAAVQALFHQGDPGRTALQAIVHSVDLPEEICSQAKKFLEMLQNNEAPVNKTPPKASKSRRGVSKSKPAEVPNITITNIHQVENNAPMNDKGDTINNSGQIASTGRNSDVHDNTFILGDNRLNEINLAALSEELAALRAELRKEVPNPTAEQDSELGALAQAEVEAKNGNQAGTLQHLRRTGKWALTVAERIGVALVAAILKDSINQ